MGIKKLIEVALPLEKINAESAREKSIRHGHPSTLHLWWARRPLAAARAVIWSSLVDDPSSHPEKFPTEEEQNKERERLFHILEDLVVWENSNDETILEAAKEEIRKSTGGNLPELLDPFAGGGAIPLEAQRLGLVAHAHDLNPVAVMINKAMIEIPPRFAGLAPINPDARENTVIDSWERAQGLAEDVRYYGEWMKQEAFRRIGHLYPKVKVPEEQGGGEATVIAWIWARTVKCPNPACGCEMPLAGSFVLSKKKGKEAWAKPISEGNKIYFEVQNGKCPKEYESYKTGRGATFKCPCCGEVTTDEYVKAEGKAGKIGNQLMAIVAEGKRGRIYISPNESHILAARVEKPKYESTGMLPKNPRWFSPPAFGMDYYDELFTNRQLTALTTFSELVAEAQVKVEADAVAAGMKDDHIPLRDGGTGAKAYGEAVGVYLSIAISRMSSYWSNITSYDTSREKLTSVFARQAIPMVWDYIEANPFCGHSGDIMNSVNIGMKAVEKFPLCSSENMTAFAEQFGAQDDCDLRNLMISTDPPYYDNIGYADLSDFFYVWIRQSLKNTYPDLFGTLLVPKAEELIATPYRHGGSAEAAKDFFEDGMLSACKQMYQYAREDIPVTIYYAYKQSDSDVSGTTSSGWETMLGAIVKAGFTITGTWPMRTEMSGRTLARTTNALASSIVLVCRKRPEEAPQTTRRNFIAELRRELRPALQKLQSSNIAPVDLAQSAIGPGMGVFSRYRRVLEADGTVMSVRSALQIINKEVDSYFNEQVGSLDAASRFCVDLYTQCAYNTLRYGEAEILANAKGASIPTMVREGVLYAKAGQVHLIERPDLPEKVDTGERMVWLLTQQFTRAMAKGGIEAGAQIAVDIFGSGAEAAKDLAYRLYTIAERKGWTEESRAYNALVVAWPDIQSRAAALKAERPEQTSLFDFESHES